MAEDAHKGPTGLVDSMSQRLLTDWSDLVSDSGAIKKEEIWGFLV